MADENYETFEDQNNQIDYDSEEEFIDDAQFEDPKGFVDAIAEDGRNFYFHFQKNVKWVALQQIFYRQGGVG